MMDKLTCYRYASIGLLVLNLAILAFFFLYRPMVGGENPPPPSLDMLDMDEAQRDAVHGLATEHQAIMRSANERQKELLNQYFSHLAETDKTAPLKLPAVYLRLEEEKISSTYAHFLQIKRLLRPEQRAQFPTFVHQSLS